MSGIHIHTSTDEITVKHLGDDFYEVWDQLGEYFATVGAQDIAEAIEHGVEVYDRRTGEQVHAVSELSPSL